MSTNTTSTNNGAGNGASRPKSSASKSAASAEGARHYPFGTIPLPDPETLERLANGPALQTTSPSADFPEQAVLDRVENVLVGVDEASRLGHSQNRGRVASSWLPAVLDVGFKSQTRWRPEAGEQKSSCSDLSHGCGESNLGSTAHSW